MKKLNTIVSTGDIINLDGKECRIGQVRRIDGKLKIALHFRVTPTTGYTEYVSTRELNKRINPKTPLTHGTPKHQATYR